MDPLTQIALTRELIDIDSTTGRERDAGAFLATTLRGLGYDVIEQPVVGDRFNVVASIGEPVGRLLDALRLRAAVHSEPRASTARLYGRGACDAKGTLVAQIAAAERLRASGETRVGLLFVVGEERGSEGAKRGQHASRQDRRS